MTKKKTTTKPTPTLKQKLIEEAQKLIGVAEIKIGTLYYFVKRDDKLVFVACFEKLPADRILLQLRGSNIKKGLEEYQWDCYGDTLVYHFGPKEIVCTEDSIDESATQPGQTKPELIGNNPKDLTVDFWILQAQQLLKEIPIKAKTNYYYIERNGILLLVPDVECQDTDNLLFCVIGKIAKTGYDKQQWRDIGKILHKNFSEGAS